jgi:hypothetical protein
MPVANQRFMYLDKQLDDERMLVDCGLTTDSTILLIRRQPTSDTADFFTAEVFVAFDLRV